METIQIKIFELIVLFFSVMIHEVSHGLVAYQLGDDTAQKAGRLNLNPLRHIDPIGSIVLPLMLWLVASPVLFGWAKPVPYNPWNLKNPKQGAALIGIAGPLSNLAIAVIFGLLLRFFVGPDSFLGLLFAIIALMNIILAVFNLMPIPPLDGSKALFAIMPSRYARVQIFLERYVMLLLLLFIFLGGPIIQPLIEGLFRFITGSALFF